MQARELVEVVDSEPPQQIDRTYHAVWPLLACDVCEVPRVDLTKARYQGAAARWTEAVTCRTALDVTYKTDLPMNIQSRKELTHG